MGVYFIAAGKTSHNREKTLDRSFSVNELLPYLPPIACEQIRRHYPDGTGVHLWGANKGHTANQLRRVRLAEYVVDVKNKEIVQVFRFCFWFETDGNRLQNFVGWDQEKIPDERRPYSHVFFLRDPMKTGRTEKIWFQEMLGELRNQNWLVGQRYFSDVELDRALRISGCETLEDFLGIERAATDISANIRYGFSGESQIAAENLARAGGSSGQKGRRPALPESLRALSDEARAVFTDNDRRERDLEDLAASLFEALAYRRFVDIKVGRGGVDLTIERDGHPVIVVDVQPEFDPVSVSQDTISKTYHQAHLSGARFVVMTNGDDYLIYDREKGLSYEENRLGGFRLTELEEDDLSTLERLR